MMTVKQVSSLTGISVRTLQFYDEIASWETRILIWQPALYSYVW